MIRLSVLVLIETAIKELVSSKVSPWIAELCNEFYYFVKIPRRSTYTVGGSIYSFKSNTK